MALYYVLVFSLLFLVWLYFPSLGSSSVGILFNLLISIIVVIGFYYAPIMVIFGAITLLLFYLYYTKVNNKESREHVKMLGVVVYDF